MEAGFHISWRQAATVERVSKPVQPPAPPSNVAFQSDPRHPALHEIGAILAVGFDLLMLPPGAGG
jgi:hypothetical protein